MQWRKNWDEEDKEVYWLQAVRTMILQFYIWRNVAFSTEEEDDVFEFEAEAGEEENSTSERQGNHVLAVKMR